MRYGADVLFCVDRRLLGTERHLAWQDDPGSCWWASAVPMGAWHLSGAVKHDAKCLDTALRLHGTMLELSPGLRWSRSVEAVAPSACDVPWARVMPHREHAAFVKRLVNSVHETTDRVTLNYLDGPWVDGGRILERLERACVDRELLERLIQEERSDSNKTALRSFLPPRGEELAPEVMYDRLATSTGRLTVAQGPSILTLRKDCRRVLRSRHGKDGLICALDFAGLEARIVLHEAGLGCSESDVYGWAGREAMKGAFERSAVKTVVLSRLYGAGRALVVRQLGRDGSEVDALLARVGELFRFDELGARLARERAERPPMRNKHGRPLLLDGHAEPSDSLLVSHWAQSTGVEVSLQGFSLLIDQLAEAAPRTHPLFVLHDALVLDVHRSDLPELMRPRFIDLPGHDRAFPLRHEIVSDENS